MRIRTPSYYRQFRCTASACGESCCVGWDICIDPETAGRYRTLPGPLGARLRREICWQDPPRFRLRPDSRCPFLNADGLCSLILEAGEGALCEICAEHPRFHNDYGPLRESGLGLCCEEAARLILFSTESPLSFDVRQTPEAGGPAPEQLDALLEARETALRLACCPAHSMEERFLLLLALGADVQDRLDEGGSPAEASRPYREEGFRIRTLEETAASVRPAPPDGLLRFWEEQEPLTEEWPLRLGRIRANPEGTASCRARLGAGYAAGCERIAAYFLFRYLLESAWDGDFLSKIKLAAAGTLLISLLDAQTLLETGDLTDRDRIRNAGLFSREAEYSPDALEAFREACWMEDFLSFEGLAALFL